jgi:hypothetical protein
MFMQTNNHVHDDVLLHASFHRLVRGYAWERSSRTGR